MNTFKKSKYFSRLIVFSMLIGILPVLIIGLLSYFKSVKIVQEKVHLANSMLMNQVTSNIEQQLQAADNSVIQFLNSPVADQSIAQLLGTSPQPDFDTYSTFSSLRTLLNQIRTPGLSNSSKLFSLSEGWTFDNMGFEFPPVQTDKTEQKILHTPMAELPASFWTSDSQKLLLVKKIPFNSASPIGMYMLEIPLHDVEQQFLSNPSIGTFMILGDTGQTVARTGTPVANLGLSGQDLLQRLDKNPNPNSMTMNWDGTRVGVVDQYSPYTGWTYVSIVNLKDLTLASRSIAWYTFCMALIVIFMILIVSVFFSRKLYFPIFRLYQSVVHMSSASNRKNDEIQSIEDEFQLLMNNQNRLSEQLQAQVSQLRNFFVVKLLQGMVKPSEIQDKLIQLNLPIDWQQYAVFAIQIGSLDDTRYAEEDRDLLMFIMNNIIEHLLADYLKLPPVVIGQSQITFFGNQDASSTDFKQSLFKIIESIQAVLTEYLFIKINIGVSRIYMDLKDTHLAYFEALEALKYRGESYEQSVLFFDDLKKISISSLMYPEEAQVELLDAIKILNSEKVEDFLHEFVRKVFAGNLSRDECFLLTLRFVLDLIQVAQDMGISVYGPFTFGEVMQELYHLGSALEVENWLKKFLVDPILKNLTERIEMEHFSISNDVKNLIEEAFQTDLSLKVCADKLNYNPSYIGQVFRKETGLSFSEYLAEYRLKMAKKWLMETEKKVAEIAESLRYTNSQNFIRYFRKTVGMTPGQYRSRFRDVS